MDIINFNKFNTICSELTVSDFISYFNYVINGSEPTSESIIKNIKMVEMIKGHFELNYSKHYKDYLNSYNHGMNSLKNDLFMDNTYKSYMLDIMNVIINNDIERIVVINDDTIMTTFLMLMIDHLKCVYGFDIDEDIFDNIIVVCSDETNYLYSKSVMSDNITHCTLSDLDSLTDDSLDNSISTIFIEMTYDPNINLALSEEKYRSSNIYKHNHNIFVFVFNSFYKRHNNKMKYFTETVKNDNINYEYNDILSVAYNGCLDSYYHRQKKYFDKHQKSINFFDRYLCNLLK